MDVSGFDQPPDPHLRVWQIYLQHGPLAGSVHPGDYTVGGRYSSMFR